MKKKGGWITMIVVVLIVALLFGAYQWKFSDWQLAYGVRSEFG